MLKTLRFMLLAALMMVCGNMFAQEETTVTWEASSGDALTTIYPDANISLKWEEGGGDFGAKYVNGSVYFYNGNRVIVAGTADDVTIKKIVFTFSGDRYSMVTCNASGKNESSYGITNSSADKTSTWEGEANSLIFRAPSQSKERYIESIAVTYTGGTTGPVVIAPKLNIETTNWNDTYDMDEAKVFVVYAKNEGNAAAENAKVTVYVDGAENTAWEVGTLAIGANNVWKNMKYDLEGIEAGEHQVKLALTADNADAFEVEKTVTFTKAAAQATFELTAQPVTVQLPAENITITVNVKNTSDIDATNVTINLWNNGIIATETIASLAAGQDTDVTFTIDALAAGTYEMQALTSDNKYGTGNFTVTVNAEEEAEVKDLAITSISGTIDQANETSNVRVIVQNNGNVDITDATITLTAGDLTLNSTVSAIKGQTGWVDFAVPTAGFEPEEAEFTATVTVEGDATPTDNTMTQKLTVVAAPAPEATFEVAAENVIVPFGATSFDIVATVRNTSSDIDATDVAIKLTKGVTEVETKTIASLAAGAKTTVTFTVTEIGEAGKTATYYVQAPKNQSMATVEVTFEGEPVEQVVDINLTAIQGITEINLQQTNIVQVLFDNNSTVDELNATITLSLNGTEVETKAITKNLNFLSFTLPTEGLTAGEEATIVAALNAENNKEGNTASLETKLNVVSGEAAPAAEIALNPVANQEVEAGEQEVSVTVAVFNNGDADAENVTVDIYKNYPEVLATATFAKVEKGGSAMKTVKFTYNFEEGKEYEFTAFTNYADADADNQMQKFTITCTAPKADVSVAKIAPIAVTTEDDVVIAATLKNNSTIDATEVNVGVYTIENLQYQLVGIMQTVDIAAGEETNVEFNLGKLAAGEYTYYVQVSEDANANNNMQDVTVKVTEPEQQTIDMAIQAIQGSDEINLKGENTYKVWYKNEGNVTVENADIILVVNNKEAGRQAVTVEAGKNGMVEFTLDVTTLFNESEDLNTVVTLTGSVNVEGDVNTDNNSSSMTATVVSKDEVVEPQFTITAQPVEVEFGTEKFDVMATIAADIAAENVEVQLFYNQTIATQTVNVTTEGTAVTFANVENPFTKAGEYTMYVLAGKAAAEVKVTVLPEAVAETIDMAITAIQGLSKIDLTKENKATVWYENKGTKDMENVTVKFSVNNDVQEATVSVAAGKNGYVEFTLDTTNIQPEDENAAVVAWVDVEGDIDTTNDKVEKVVPVVNGETPVATFAVTAENVTVPFGAQSFDIVATVTNTSDVDAQGLTVKLLKGIEEVETKTLNILLAAGKSETVTFTVNAPEGGFVAGTAMYYVQAVNAQAEVTVTFAGEAIEEKVDLAVSAIQGSLSLDVENNYLTVFVDNLGTVDMTNVPVRLTIGNGVYDGTIASVKAGSEYNSCLFTIPAADLWVGEVTVTATVTAENDVNTENNTQTKTYTIAAAKPELSFTVADVTTNINASTLDVKVTVKNSEKAAAENVIVTVYDENSAQLGTATIENLAAGAEQTVTITVNKTYTQAGTYNSQLQVTVSGVEGVKWVAVTVTEQGVGIAALKAQYGDNVQIFTVNGQKVNDVRKGGLYIINGKKTIIK